MRVMKATIYRDYWIVVNPAPTPSGKFRDSFSIHKLIDGRADTTVTAHQHSISVASEFDTEDEAIESAHKQAGAWIDSQYEKPQG